jgi:hypothetical protein
MRDLEYNLLLFVSLWSVEGKGKEIPVHAMSAYGGVVPEY